MTNLDYKNSSEFKKYYQIQADIIGIFWQFHKERLRTGNIKFCQMPDVTPPSKCYELQSGKIRPIESFALTIERSLHASWKEFLFQLNSKKDSHEIDEEPSPIADSSRKFIDPYVVDLIREAEDLNRSFGYDRFLFRSPTAMDIVGAGIRNGSEATTQMAALFGIGFKPIMAVTLSKVELNKLSYAREGIGLDSGASTRYSLLDTSNQGLDRQKLKELGLGKTPGCPASMKVSERTKQFLLDRGVSNIGETTMLEEFSAMTSENFDTHIGSWFRELTPKQRENLIEPEALMVLDGTARSRVLEGNQMMGRCPYSGGKERMG